MADRAAVALRMPRELPGNIHGRVGAKFFSDIQAARAWVNSDS